MELARFLASLHPFLVHFPIALLLVGVGADLASYPRRSERLSWAGLWLTLIGTTATLFAFVCGILAEVFAARSGIPLAPMERHEWLATWTTWLFLALASIRLFMGLRPGRAVLGVYLLFALLGCALLLSTARLGGEVVYEYGANVAGVRALRPMTDEDLATVAQHQEQRSLTYSNQMHHLFGWLVLALGISILCERLRIPALSRLRELMPFVFLSGGGYLFVYSDWDSWPISNLRPITDVEVLLHKILAILMCLIGLAALRRVRVAASEESQAAGANWAWQNKLIAVMALVGGGVLFTHIHTNAPYVGNAIGVYLHHCVMGAVALAIVGTMLLETALAGVRSITTVFPLLVILEAGLLLNYNEDLPWFLGYGVIDATPPRDGLLAHVPGGRAELTFEPSNGTLEVYFWEAASANPRAVDFEVLTGFVTYRHERRRLQFRRAEGRPPRFRAQARWLRKVPLFVVQLEIPTAHGVITTEFDPCVTAPLLPPLVGAVRVFGCPMCPEVLAGRPGQCPMCAMALTEVPRARMRQTPLPLNDGRYRMDLNVEGRPERGPVPPTAVRSTTVRLQFMLRDRATGASVRNIRVVHERKLHLFIVSEDLSYFDHVHPEQQADGSFAIVQTLPRAGHERFVLFADLAPEGSRSQVFRLPLELGGGNSLRRPPREDAHLTRVFRGREVTLHLTPHRLQARQEAQLVFQISRNGQAVTDLGRFLGAVGHCVIISEDTREFIHAHAAQLTAAPATGPDLIFHARFPKPGRYKVWAQFNHRGTVVTADFVVRVI